MLSEDYLYQIRAFREISRQLFDCLEELDRVRIFHLKEENLRVRAYFLAEKSNFVNSQHYYWIMAKREVVQEDLRNKFEIFQNIKKYEPDYFKQRDYCKRYLDRLIDLQIRGVF